MFVTYVTTADRIALKEKMARKFCLTDQSRLNLCLPQSTHCEPDVVMYCVVHGQYLYYMIPAVRSR